MPIRQSVCYPMFRSPDRSLDTLFSHIASVGFKAVEMAFRGDDFEEVATVAGRHGLVIASMCGHRSISSGLNDPAEQDRIVAELTESIDLAAEHGVRGLVCFSGNRRPELTEDQAIETIANGLKRVTRRAEQNGVNLNLELLNSKIDHPDYQCDRTGFGLQICRRVASPRVQLLYDIYHMQIMEGDIIRTITANWRHIGHVHVAGNPGRNDPDERQELNYPAICRAIAATGYDGYLGHEFKPRAEPLEALRIAFSRCNVD